MQCFDLFFVHFINNLNFIVYVVEKLRFFKNLFVCEQWFEIWGIIRVFSSKWMTNYDSYIIDKWYKTECIIDWKLIYNCNIWFLIICWSIDGEVYFPVILNLKISSSSVLDIHCCSHLKRARCWIYPPLGLYVSKVVSSLDRLLGLYSWWTCLISWEIKGCVLCHKLPIDLSNLMTYTDSAPDEFV